MYKKYSIYALVITWVATLCSILFILKNEENENSIFGIFEKEKDSSSFAFYDKKMLGRNEKTIKSSIAIEEQVKVNEEAIKSTIMRQSFRQMAETKPENKNQIKIEKPRTIPRPKSSSDFEIRGVPTN